MGIRFFSNRKEKDFKGAKEKISNLDGKSLKYQSTSRSGGGTNNFGIYGFRILEGPSPEIGEVVDMQVTPSYLFSPNSSYKLEFFATTPFTCNWEMVGEGRNGLNGIPAVPDPGSQPWPPAPSPNPGTPSTLSNTNFTMTAGAGTGGRGGGGSYNGNGTPGAPGSGGVGTLSTPGPTPGTFTNTNGAGGAGGPIGGGPQPFFSNGLPGTPADTVYTGSILPASRDGGPNSGGTGGLGLVGGGGRGGGGGGGGAATGAYVLLENHVTQPGNYFLNVGPGNSGAAIIFQGV